MRSARDTVEGRMAAAADEAQPLCRIAGIAAHAEPLWRWEASVGDAVSEIAFSSLHECAEDARRHGFQVDLVRAPLVLLPARGPDG